MGEREGGIEGYINGIHQSEKGSVEAPLDGVMADSSARACPPPVECTFSAGSRGRRSRTGRVSSTLSIN